MANLNFTQHTHSDRLERWIGHDLANHLSKSMVDWYGPPIAAMIPGNVRMTKGGEFIGHIDAGSEGSLYDRAEDTVRRLYRNGQEAKARWAAKQLTQLNVGFSSLSDLIQEATGGKRREIFFQKNGATGATNSSNSLWQSGAQPAAGGAGSAAPGGRALDNTTTGAVYGLDAVSTDTRHVVFSQAIPTLPNTLLMYDRIFDVAKTMSSTGTESVTGVPTRYQSSTATAQDYAGGNFLFVEVQTNLGATGHNWTVCQYRDEAGNDAQTLPSLTGNASATAQRLDHPIGQWFAPLAAGDIGVMDLHQMQCSASVTGAINFVIGHPLVWIPCPVTNLLCTVDHINTAFNLVRVYDTAALAWLEVNKPASTATSYTGSVTLIHG